MSPGEIPVNVLTHLNIAFGYISADFQVTNMDGLSSSIYQNVGNVKARNPSIKLIIALGGWSFSDPGPWQAIFPTLVSTAANRATFITNLLGFLGQYGYDGVDFDWEYPGADDRGGTDDDGTNYTALLKELREAIIASGKDYIVTFTAPTSYWYLRHFDLANMVQYVDWVNLMAYDLHGVWDSSNPIGNQVLAHTNLTEIDLALDLFWRVDVEPSKIVLGLGFYGRSFQLTDASCWKPGCSFSGPGAAGSCTNTPGILSYREISAILTSTGASAYLDEDAAVRYLVYGNSSWVSYDDAVTFAAKIEYANKMGLSGLMIWAVDLDDSMHTALRAVSAGADSLGAVENPFNLVDISYLFPIEYLPPDDATPSYGLINFGSAADADGSMDPSKTGFGFVLLSGDSYAVSSLRKRSGEPEPFVFLDCPDDIADAPDNVTHTARVVCLSSDVQGCFRVLERGIEGTIVEMPDNCAPNSFARAISLEPSVDQSMDVFEKRSGSKIHHRHIRYHKRAATSIVYDFAFDFDMRLVRRDTNNTSLRIDYSNIGGYWDAIVDAPGIQSRSLSSAGLAGRFFAPTVADWVKQEAASDDGITYSTDNALPIKEDVTATLFWQTAEDCPVNGESYEEGIGAYVQGSVDASFSYGFSIIATLGAGGVDIKQASAMFAVEGETDLTYALGGIGQIDVSLAGKGNPAFSSQPAVNLGGHTVSTGGVNSFVSFNPYYQITYQMATFNQSNNDVSGSEAGAAFDGKMSTRIVSDLGSFTAYFPPDDSMNLAYNDKRSANKIEVAADSNVLYSTTGNGGKVAIGTYLAVGLKIDFSVQTRALTLDLGLADMFMSYNTMTEFSFEPDSAGTSVCADYDVITNIFQFVDDDSAELLKWDSSGVELAYDRQTPADGQECYAVPLELASTDAKRRRAENTADVNPLQRRQSDDYGSMPIWGYDSDFSIDPSTYFGSSIGAVVAADQAIFGCKSCYFCEETLTIRLPCCGCVNMDLKYGYSDIPSCPLCNADDGSWPGVTVLKARDEAGTDDEDEDNLHFLSERSFGTATMISKIVSVCDKNYYLAGSYRYPAFPSSSQYPWEGIDNGDWDSISRYWGNTSSDCTNWQIGALSPADKEYISASTQVRAKYQTEHVFEGQLIGDFFTLWLDQGHINNQMPAPANPQPKVSCMFTTKYITNAANQIFLLGTNDVTFIDLLLSELGSKTHLDRLTIMQARPNLKKGCIFKGVQPTSATKYIHMSSDEQLQSVKEMGLIFNYLNEATVWDKFCATYEAIYEHMGDFDTWYAANGVAVAIPSLQAEWKEYIRVSLDSAVLRSRATFDYMASNRK